MAEYYENRFMHDLGQEIKDPIRIQDMSNVTPEIIIANMSAICEEKNIPALFSESSVEILEGVFIKNKYKAIKISYPNPPQRYCDQLYVIFSNSMRFFFVGASDAFSAVNNYQAAVEGTGGNLKAKFQAITGLPPDMAHYEAEMEWHQLILAVFDSIIY